MRPLSNNRIKQVHISKQRGVVLFFALIAVVLMSLAAVALIRSVDTSTMIAGNLAFKQSATSASDAGINTAAAQLAAIESANTDKNVITDPTHPFNISNAAIGYYSYVNDIAGTAGFVDLLAEATWNAITATPETVDNNSGNRIRYIIQRMCRNINQPIQDANCLFSDALQDNNQQNIPLPQEICEGVGCPAAGQSPQIRITARSVGPRNTVSYVQVFVY